MLMFSIYIMCFTYNLLYCYLFSKYVLKEKFIFKKEVVILSLIFAIPLSLNYHFNNTPLKPFISQFICFSNLLYCYRQSLIKTLIGVLVSFGIISIGELIFTFIAVYGLAISQDYLNNTPQGVILTNICIFIIVQIISNIKKVKTSLSAIINSFKGRKDLVSVIIIILFISILVFIIYQNLYEQANMSYLILINLFFIGVYVFIIGFFLEKDNNNNLIAKYDQLYEYSKTYEQELIRRSKRQHEFENQLIIIKGMVQDNDIDTISYIDGLLKDDEENKDVRWLSKLANIPLGGLKGLLYFKINEMVDKKISVNLEVSESLNKKSSWKTYTNNPQDISKIIGVYLDNAIEAASVAETKEIEIQFYKQGKNIVFCLGNTYKGKIDESKLDLEGYSSKGNNRGYGLSLVKDLISKHPELEQERVIIDQYYVQNLIMKSKIK